jgi:SAM-dependent methyltransferase
VLCLDSERGGLVLGHVIGSPETIENVKAEVAAENVLDQLADAPRRLLLGKYLGYRATETVSGRRWRRRGRGGILPPHRMSSHSSSPPANENHGSVDAVDNIARIYRERFDELDAARKDGIWKAITGYLQRFIDPEAVVVDIACDRGDFVRNIRAGEKWATDLRDVAQHLTPDVRFVQANGLELDRELPRSHFDVAFMSNYLEHLPGGDAVIRQLEVARQLLKPGGRVIVLQPNIRLVGHRYWDFIDHSVALTERSLIEASELAGLTSVRMITRFLPFTTKSRLPQSPLLVRMYLAFPPAWFLLGKQTLLVAEKPGTS